MASEIIVNATDWETRVALVENKVLVELYIEHKKDKGTLGNVYKGRVSRVLPGMQAAFMDIGLEKAGFLYVSDIDFKDIMLEHDNLLGEVGIDHAVGSMEDSKEYTSMESSPAPPLPIEEMLREGQEILVQISKNPLGFKGARVTSYVSLPGRYLVFMPTINQVGISRRIESEEERERLRQIVMELKPPGSGYIIRTASQGQHREELENDVIYLNKLWQNIKKKAKKTRAPNMIYQDLDLILRAIRDLVTKDVENIIIDNEEAYKHCTKFVESYLPHLSKNIKLYEGKENIFDYYGFEVEISRSLGRKIWLKSGGNITIDQTEALTAIDVNTGKFVGKRNLEDTILKTNMEAVKEIVYQIRLRNIGGLIILDFIDMEKDSSKEMVYGTLELALKNDRTHTSILKISELGLVEMTRKRVRDSITRILCEPCPYCEGRGTVKSARTVCYDIFREINRVSTASLRQKFFLTVNPSVADLLLDEESDCLEKLEKSLTVQIVIKADSSIHQEIFEIIPT
jgi:ribonuclease G